MKTGRPLDSVRHRYRRILEESGAYQRFQQILKKTKNEQNFIKAFELAEDRASGKALQSMDVEMNDVSNRPTADALNAALRSVNGNSAGVELDKS